MQGIFQKENTDKALKYGIYRHLPTYEKIIRNLVSFYTKKLIKDGRRIGSNPYGVTVDFIEATDINNPIDFDLAQVIFDHYIKNNTESDNNGNNE